MSTAYKVRSSDPEALVHEVDRVFKLLAERLDKMEGFHGTPTFYNSIKTEFDINAVGTSRGLVLKDDGNPANFWRVTVNSAGNLVRTKLGTSL